MKNQYKYSVIEYLPDQVTGEHVNVGVLIHDMETKRLKGKTTKNFEEIRRRYPEFPDSYYEVLQSVMEERNYDCIFEDTELLNHIYHPRDSISAAYVRVFFSEPRGSVSELPIDEELDELYKRFVTIDKSKN